MKWRISLVFIGVFILAASFGAISQAATKPNGVTIAPAFQEVTLLEKQSVSTQGFTIENNDNVAVTFNLSVVDMGALEDTGGVVFTGLSTGYQKTYGLAKWIKLDRDTVTLAGHSSQTINFTITNDDTLTPGGHYGAIIVKSTSLSKVADNQVRVSPESASLLFVRKTNGEKYQLSASSASPGTSFFRLPRKVSIKFHNSGNVHVVPRGTVIIKNSSGRQVAKGIINPESSLTLPEHSRTYTSSLLQIQKLPKPGRYTLNVSYRYDGTDKFTTYSSTFIFIDVPYIALGLLAGCLVAFLGWLIFSKRRVINGFFQKIHQKVIHRHFK